MNTRHIHCNPSCSLFSDKHRSHLTNGMPVAATAAFVASLLLPANSSSPPPAVGMTSGGSLARQRPGPARKCRLCRFLWSKTNHFIAMMHRIAMLQEDAHVMKISILYFPPSFPLTLGLRRLCTGRYSRCLSAPFIQSITQSRASISVKRCRVVDGQE